ncbi:MAG: hypothetical protein ACXWQQ_13675 [Pseudobdellovibrio sp.]
MKFLILAFVFATLSALAQTETDCKTDADCKSAGADFTCQPQKTGCPGHESDSTCVIHICRKYVAPVAPPALKKEEAKDLAWLDKNRDAQGCVALSKLTEDKNCPEKIELQIRPLTVGFLKTEKKSPKNICCYDWKTFGNR